VYVVELYIVKIAQNFFSKHYTRQYFNHYQCKIDSNVYEDKSKAYIDLLLLTFSIFVSKLPSLYIFLQIFTLTTCNLGKNTIIMPVINVWELDNIEAEHLPINIGKYYLWHQYVEKTVSILQ
jgi:hypothetical protein